MSLRYKDKIVIVTGGSKGIGEGIVRVFVENGAKVVFCARGEEDGKSLEAEINALGPGESYFIKADVSKDKDIKDVVEKTMAKYSQINCLVNNAGWHPPKERIDNITVENFQALFNLNLINYFLFSKYTLPHIRKTKGNIINISSHASKMGEDDSVSYITTKGAIDGFTKALAVDEAKHEVRVNSVSPGNIWTPLWNSLAQLSENPEATINLEKTFQLQGRFGTISEIGQACLYLAADATFCTGLDLLATGGAELNYGCKSKFLQANNT